MKQVRVWWPWSHWTCHFDSSGSQTERVGVDTVLPEETSMSWINWIGNGSGVGSGFKRRLRLPCSD